MKRRVFLTGSIAALASLAGCSGGPLRGSNDSPTTASRSSDQPTRKNSTETPDSPIGLPRAEITTTEPESTTIPQWETGAACGGVNEISFYALGEIGSTIWRPNTVWVDLDRSDSARVRLVVLEGDTVLGMTRAEAPTDNGAFSDEYPIVLRTTLSGEHTIRVVAYPATKTNAQFRLDEAAPYQYEDEVVRTESIAVDLSRFAGRTPPSETE